MWKRICIGLCLLSCGSAKEPIVAHATEQTQPATNPSDLTVIEADALVNELWEAYRIREIKQRAQEHDNRTIVHGDHTLRFWYQVYGERPESGRSLYLSLHGGGGAPAQVNDGQYENQKKLYQPKEGVYFVPRAPTNTWNLWHQGHIDPLFQRVIEHMVLFESVDPNKVYLMGYSAGGDGVYQVAPRMADRFAAAAMMAGHPNETQPDGLRNLPFAIHVGEHDSGYQRNAKAKAWKDALAERRNADPEGYPHVVQLHAGRGHWMNLEDRVAVPWMAQYQRARTPQRVVWRQDDVTQTRFYWLAVSKEHAKPRTLVRARREGQVITIEHSDVDELSIRLNDDMVDFNQPIVIRYNEQILFEGRLTRSEETLRKTFDERHDPTNTFSAERVVRLRP